MQPLSSNTRARLEIRRRARLFSIFVLLVFLVLVYRLWALQVSQGKQYTVLSEHNRMRLERIPGIRGMIFDRKGRLLVNSRPSFDIVFVPEGTRPHESTLRKLASMLDRDEADFFRIVRGRKKNAKIVTLERDVDWESVVLVEAHQMDLPGVSLRVRPQRSYLTQGVMAHMLGYIGEISPKQLRRWRKRGYGRGDAVGKFGLEKKWERHLAGRSGGEQVEVDALGRKVRVLNRLKSSPGHNVILTVDMDLQESAHRALEGKEGSIVVMEVKTGAILAMVSAPAFDPNAFARGLTPKEWRKLMFDKERPLHNRAIQGQFPPGSIFKIIVALAGLSEEVIRPQQRFFCPGSHVVGNRVFRDWKKQGHGHVNLHKALVESCDVYFYQLGQKLGVDKIAKHSRLFGLGSETGIDLDDEKPGLIPDKKWKKRRYKQPWYPGETPSVSIGQGFVSVTPLQVVNFMSAVANGGTLHRPWFVRRVEAANGEIIEQYGPETKAKIALDKKHLEAVRSALRDVVHSDRGTGKRARSTYAEVAGKTGTAQVMQIRGKMIKSEDLPYEVRDHAWFVAYAPAEDPEIAIVTLVEHGGHGGSTSAPIAKEIIDTYFRLAGREVALPQSTGTSIMPGSHAN